MADTGGIAALLNALDGTPGLGAGLKPSAKASRSAEFFAAAAGGSVKGSAASGAAAAASASAAPTSSIRVNRQAAPASAKPRQIIADGQSYDAKAPRGTYLDMVI